ncbi:hypothetical protein ACS0TY_000978 [Phlomoides rotata]
MGVDGIYDVLLQCYVTKETYNTLAEICDNEPIEAIAYAWRVLWDRLPTKVNLQRRNVISSNDNLKCVFCGDKDESGNHIFFECQFSYKVWMSCFNWLVISTTFKTLG